MRYLFGLSCLCTLGLVPLVGCGGTGGGGGTGGTDLCEGVDCDDGNECTTDECSPTDGACSNTALDDGSFCEAGYCESGECDPIASIFPCTEQGIRDAIAAGGGPHGFACDSAEVVTSTSELVINNDVILDGRDKLRVDGNDDHVVFSVPAGVAAELRRFTVSGGFTPGDLLKGSAGGIANEGALKLANSTVSGNSAGQTGSAGIWNAPFASLVLTNSTVADNSGGEVGFGGIWNTGTLALRNSAVSGNSAGAFGINGIFNDDGTLTLVNSTVSGNIGGRFGGIFNEKVLTLVNSTVSGNSGESSGGIFNSGGATLTMTNSTVSGNTAESGASIVNVADEVIVGVLIIANSVVDGDCEGVQQGPPGITSSGYNIESPGDSCGFDQATDQVHVSVDDLKLGLLADNGGPTQTQALAPGSVAIDQIPETECVDADGERLATDQRGVARPQGRACDVGAFEIEVQP